LNDNKQLKQKKEIDLISLAIVLLQGFQQNSLPLPFELIRQIFLFRTDHLKLRPEKELIEKVKAVHSSTTTIYKNPRSQPQPQSILGNIIRLFSRPRAPAPEEKEFLETRQKPHRIM
jgi:hypothetical protein